MASGPITSWQIDGEKVETVAEFILGGCGSEVKASDSNAGNSGSIPGSGRSPGEGNDNLFQHPCLENPTDRGAWWAAVHVVPRSEFCPFSQQQ